MARRLARPRPDAGRHAALRWPRVDGAAHAGPLPRLLQLPRRVAPARSSAATRCSVVAPAPPDGASATSRRSCDRSVTRLLALPDHTVVHTGHGDSTTIGAEREGVLATRGRTRTLRPIVSADPLPVTGIVQHYAWGDPSFIPACSEPSPTARRAPSCGSAPTRNGPTMLDDGRPLAEVTGELPYLLKVLAAAEPLSLQVHPTTDAGSRRLRPRHLPRRPRQARAAVRAHAVRRAVRHPAGQCRPWRSWRNSMRSISSPSSAATEWRQRSSASTAANSIRCRPSGVRRERSRRGIPGHRPRHQVPRRPQRGRHAPDEPHHAATRPGAAPDRRQSARLPRAAPASS